MFFEAVILEPTYSPIGLIAVSAPKVKRPMPKISITAPIRKATKIAELTGKKAISRISTIAVTGSTEDSASEIFSHRFDF
jgi:hypothetical protein